MSFSVAIGLSRSPDQSLPYIRNHLAVHFDFPAFYSPDQYHTYETVILCVFILRHFSTCTFTRSVSYTRNHPSVYLGSSVIRYLYLVPLPEVSYTRNHTAVNLGSSVIRYLYLHQISILHTKPSCCTPWFSSISILVSSTDQHLTHEIILLYTLIV